MALHILLDRGMVSGSVTIHMHESWEFLKYKLTGMDGGRRYIEAPVWDRHQAWHYLSDGHLIVDGASMWCYINGYEFSGLDDHITQDLFRPGPNRDIIFLSEMTDAEGLMYYHDTLKMERMTYEQWKAAGLDKKHESEMLGARPYTNEFGEGEDLGE